MGFIGSNLTDNLLELGAEVIYIDNLFNGRLENLDDAFKHVKFKFYKGDMRDLNFLLNKFKDIDIIFYLAAFTSVPQSVKMPENCNKIFLMTIMDLFKLINSFT